VLKNQKRYDGQVGQRHTSAYMQIRKNISSRVVQSNATSFVHIPYEAKVATLCNIGGCITLKWH
jgi:hypothetical protein